VLYRGVSIQSGQAVEVSVEGGLIEGVAVIEDEPSLPYMSPGFFDMQVNGYRGIDYGYSGLEPEDVEPLVFSLASSGITGHLATVITNPPEVVMERLDMLRLAVEQSAVVGDALMGIHVEGPFISPEDGPRGAHDPHYVRDPDFSLFHEWYDASKGMIKMITLAPELNGAIEFIEKVSDLGVVCAIGHTAAGADRIKEAVDAGARLSTHLGNGSHASLPRLRNHIWEQAAEDRLWVSIICDGYHLPPAVVRVMARAKGLARLILIGDSTGLTGKPPGKYTWGETETEIAEDGHITLSGTPYLAGAGFLLDWDIAHFIRYTGVSLGDAITLCTENPRRFFGITPNRIEAGAPANLTLFDYAPGMDRLEIRTTLLAGKKLYSSTG